MNLFGGKEKQATREGKPASWDTFPGFEKFWDAYIDLFWGTGGSTPYHDMLKADFEWLKGAYMANEEMLKKLEADFVSKIERTQGRYERNLEGSRIPIQLNGKTLANVVPPAVGREQEALRRNRLETAGATHGIQAGAAQRLLEQKEKFTPHAADRSYMEVLKGQGMAGQQARSQFPTTTETLPGQSTLSQIRSGTETMTGIFDLFGSLRNVNDTYNIWGKTSKFGEDIWGTVANWSDDFWGWLF